MAEAPRPFQPVVVPSSPKRIPITDLVESVIQQAVTRRASDIHLEPDEKGMNVRFRVDGLLQHAPPIASEDRAAVVSRIKIMANLDIAEHRLPQDGRIRLQQNQRMIDIRVSTIPSLHGEKVVLRLLDLEGVTIPLAGIGLDSASLAELRRLARRPQGTILMTGPTGSGKTSTIYACLNDIKSETTNIVTIEDPIEYEMGGVTQIAVHEKIGLTFATCLRSVLRQDPDVILVGEIRDLDTARIAMQASLTGHLVFSTLHTNDAVGAITRLLDMEIPPYLIAASLSAVLAQRLLRRLCSACKYPTELPDKTTRDSLWEPPDPSSDAAASLDRTFYRAPGCERCYGTGAVGRTGIFELLPLTTELRRLIGARAAETELRRAARRAGVRSMFRDGLRRVWAGEVAYEELLRVAEPERPAGSKLELERPSDPTE